MRRDPLWFEIQQAIERPLSGHTFERCAQDLLRGVYPGLAPVVGGSDAGMDGAVGSAEGALPLICTTESDVIGNVRKSMANHLKKRGQPRRCVVATSQRLTPTRRDNITEAAKSVGMTVVNIHDQEDIIGRLYEHAAWRLELLGVTGELPALSVYPPALRRSDADLLVGRDADLAWLRDARGDALVVGQPGSGKTHLHQHLAAQSECLFAITGDETRLTNAVRSQRPAVVVIDDAHVRLEWIDLLRRLRQDVGASFRIHANCWPGYRNSVQDRLGIGESDVRTLRAVPRKVLHKLIQRLGVAGPDPLLYLLLTQAVGRPGLCAALVEAVKRGEIDRIWTGDALADRMLVTGRSLRDETDREILARFALGGDAGVAFATVAADMGMPRSELRQRLAALGDGGVIAEQEQNGRIAVLPEPLRAVLVRDVFYRGIARPDLDDALAHCPDATASTHVLISAKQREAAIPSDVIRQRVFAIDDAKLWEHYAHLDAEAANAILARRPDRVRNAGSGLLQHVPSQAVEALIRSDQESPELRRGRLDDPQRLISDWMCEWDHEEQTGIRRAVIVDALDRVQKSPTPLDAPLLLQYLGSLIDPNLHGTRSSPADRLTVVYRQGVYGEAELKQIADLWPRVMLLLPTAMCPQWRKFLESVGEWAWPGRGSDRVPAELVQWMKQVARTMVSDMVGLPQCGRALRKALRYIDGYAELGLGIGRDDFYDVVMDDREHGETWEARQERREAEFEALADRVLQLGADQGAAALGAVEREAAEFDGAGDGWERSRLYSKIAERVESPTVWLGVLQTERIAATMLAPFIRAVRTRASDQLYDIVGGLLHDTVYQELARGDILRDSHAPDHLVDAAFASLAPAGDQDAYRFHYPAVPVNRMLRLMSHDNADVRLAAAVGEWALAPEHAVRPELLSRFREVIIDAEPAHNTAFNMLLEGELGLATEWARRRITAGNNSIYRFEHLLIRVIHTLSPADRADLADCMTTPERYEADVFDAVIGTDADTYRAWFCKIKDPTLRLRTLRRPPSDHWRARLVVALDAGVPLQDIINQIGGGGDSWSGPASAHFEQRARAYDALMGDPDARLHPIAAEGKAQALSMVKAARERESGEQPE